jgi:thiopeptide-type bacteriocin biosynthesis protein
MPASDHPVDHAVGLLRTLVPLIENCVDRDAFFDDADSAAVLSEFLAICARSLTTGPAPGRDGHADEFYQARDIFLRVGLDALLARSRSSRAIGGWLQLGIRPRQELEPRGELCQQISSLVRQLMGDSALDDFFFMNKPPGMRLRLHGASAGSVRELADVLHVNVTRWRAEGLVDYIEPGVYEPESELFGGPESMNFVHALFTVDSLLWLDYHACRAVEGAVIGPAWLASLALLRTVFAGLDIAGWEDISVWNHIRQMAGRRLGANKDSLPMYSEIAGQIVEVWSRGDGILHELHPAVKEIVDRYYSALFAGAAQWRTGYFCRRGASLGTRAAAALYVVFHWNRAALSPMEQALLAESLCGRVLEDDRK